ncbi:hypothetical protein [Actinoallomurus acaciae]|uniref:DUF222 domain-containing protein n=1 Tax=Actinoallomurus acaciae TaxID=502577 RepID=A0ABV5YJE6_9ACTN
MAKYGIFEKAVQGFLRFPATKRAAEDISVSPAEMIRGAVKAQKRIDEETSRIEAAAPKAVDQTELLRQQIRDAADSQTKIGREAWRVDVQNAASRAAFDPGFQHTELERVLDALTERSAPIPLHPIADAEIKKMLATPAGIREATNLYLDPAAMKEWQTRLLQKQIDEKVLAAQEKLGPTIKAAAYGRRLDEIQQAAEELDLQAERAYQKASLEQAPGETIPFRCKNEMLGWYHGGSWQNSEHWLSGKERDDLARLGVEAGEIETMLHHLPIDVGEEEKAFRLLADATDIADHDPGLALDTSKLDEIRRLCPQRSTTYPHKPDNSTQITQISEHALRPRILFDIFGRIEVIELPDGASVERPLSTTVGWVTRWEKGASFPFWPERPSG